MISSVTLGRGSPLSKWTSSEPAVPLIQENVLNFQRADVTIRLTYVTRTRAQTAPGGTAAGTPTGGSSDKVGSYG